jgi:flagellar biosynthesis protein FliP
MTVAEIQRFMDGAVWRMKSQAQFDYSLANLIGVSVARIMSNEVEFPTIEKVYPDLFESVEEERAQAQEEIATQNSINHFMEFAMKHNAKMRGVEKINNDN